MSLLWYKMALLFKKSLYITKKMTHVPVKGKSNGFKEASHNILNLKLCDNFCDNYVTALITMEMKIKWDSI